MKLKEKMKKFIMVFAAVSIFTACMKDGPTYSMSGVFSDAFEYSNADELFKDGAEYFFFYQNKDQAGNVTDPTGILPVSHIEYYNKHKDGYLFGGLVLSRQTWERTETPESSDPDTPKPSANENTPSVPGPYSVYGKTGATNSRTFMFLLDSGRENMAKHDINFVGASVGTFAPTVVMVNNSAAIVRAITGESGKEFNLTGDYTLTATGYLDSKKTGSADFLLAGKGRGKVPGTDSLVTGWKTFDISKLGNIQYVDFSLSTPEGISVQKSVCLDNFTGNIAIQY